MSKCNNFNNFSIIRFNFAKHNRFLPNTSLPVMTPGVYQSPYSLGDEFKHAEIPEFLVTVDIDVEKAAVGDA